ncbi:MAG: hypothetical protein QXG00_08455 [Candidatus Woesearchaeota archaeon]
MNGLLRNIKNILNEVYVSDIHRKIIQTYKLILKYQTSPVSEGIKEKILDNITEIWETVASLFNTWIVRHGLGSLKEFEEYAKDNNKYEIEYFLSKIEDIKVSSKEVAYDIKESFILWLDDLDLFVQFSDDQIESIVYTLSKEDLSEKEFFNLMFGENYYIDPSSYYMLKTIRDIQKHLNNVYIIDFDSAIIYFDQMINFAHHNGEMLQDVVDIDLLRSELDDLGF